ncbi:AcrR family transcriptional regulator [Neorhizobium huautlense]|uniref:AcrR family transcriptional regulator n=1 Tax=Neorhizobium huautlense TaxID=67774 RepID=A0ABT9PM55_9HYPH|nr:TetR/AcrR family transcriptional regulator [Neorhizobium huautlense]MDP9835547.1 AcrR family transcriptional regulator [Neorhizobium huautlense]
MTSNDNSTREELLARVGDIFYANGTYLVGMTELIRHLQTTRATFYRHFEGKEDLLVAYLEKRDIAVREQLATVVSGRKGADAILDVFSNLERKTNADNFRGCAFLIAAIENPQSPRIQATARNHKLFLKNFFSSLLHKDHDGSTAEQLLLLYDGALAGSILRREAGAATAAKAIAARLMEAA